MTSLVAWITERLPVSPGALAELTNEPVPNHLKKWWFALGGTPAYLFVVQIVTGILLAFYYEASIGQSAYESVRAISRRMSAFGWFIRGVHKWARDTDDCRRHPAPDAGLLHRCLSASRGS